MNKKGFVLIAAVMLLIFSPFIFSLFYLNLVTEILILAIFALSLNILVGYTGLVSLGHAAFFWNRGLYVRHSCKGDISKLFPYSFRLACGCNHCIRHHRNFLRKGERLLFSYVNIGFFANDLFICPPVNDYHGRFKRIIRHSKPFNWIT